MRLESGEITVTGNPRAAFGDCKRRALCVRDEFSDCRSESAQLQDALKMVGARDDQAALRLGPDFLDCRDCSLGWS
jgi:hypothetical protein